MGIHSRPVCLPLPIFRTTLRLCATKDMGDRPESADVEGATLNGLTNSCRRLITWDE
jgi:hypothetical protein